jgi:hypothetical protein
VAGQASNTEEGNAQKGKGVDMLSSFRTTRSSHCNLIRAGGVWQGTQGTLEKNLKIRGKLKKQPGDDVCASHLEDF